MPIAIRLQMVEHRRAASSRSCDAEQRLLSGSCSVFGGITRGFRDPRLAIFTNVTVVRVCGVTHSAGLCAGVIDANMEVWHRMSLNIFSIRAIRTVSSGSFESAWCKYAKGVLLRSCTLLRTSFPARAAKHRSSLTQEHIRNRPGGEPDESGAERRAEVQPRSGGRQLVLSKISL